MADDSGKKPTRIYFYTRMDIMLVMEVLQRNPYQNGNGAYAAVAAELRKSDQFRDVQPRALQERTERLLKAFRSSQMQSMKRSGSEEEYDERERLLQDLSDMEKEWTGTHKRAATPPPNASEVRKKAAKLHAMGKAMQDKLGAPMRPSSSTAAEPQLNNDGAQVQVVQLEEEPGEDNRDQDDLAHADEQPYRDGKHTPLLLSPGEESGARVVTSRCSPQFSLVLLDDGEYLLWRVHLSRWPPDDLLAYSALEGGE
ncbi:hypothetical protein ACOMHN_008696 [Nucella lapillus]